MLGMEPRIKYARSGDGVNIAYWTLGEGEPLVYMAGGPWNHIELWEIPECRRWYERMAQGRMLVRYDVRGTGLVELLLEHYPDERPEAMEHLEFAIGELRDMKMQPSLERALRHREIMRA